MPELPEVETVRRQLAPRVEGRTFRRVRVLDERWCMPLAPREMERALRGRRVESLGRRGKYLVWKLSGERFLLQHLRMTGNLLYDPAERPPYTRVEIDLDDGHELRYVDMRRFGTGQLADGRGELDAFLDGRLGLEPFDPDFDAEHLWALARGSRTPVKSFLLDQKRIAGVGNIYADESLHRARLRPDRLAGTLSRKSAQRLHESLRVSLLMAIKNRGSSVDTYRDAWGEIGGQQEKLLVYGRAGEPCFTCGRPLALIRIAGRSTVFCRRCQR